MSFEDSFLKGIDQRRRQKPREAIKAPALEEAHTRAKKMLNDPDYAIQAPDFFDLYGQDNVMNDMRRVKAKRDSFVQTDTPEKLEAKKVSDVFEAIMLEQTELSDWLGEKVSVLKTSLFDDYFNGTDMIAEWSQEGRESNVLGLAVDVTFGMRGVEEKLMHIRRNVDGGKLGSIKYFKNNDGSFRRERNNIPHVVIGVSKQTVQELADLWIKNDKKALGVHPIQRAIIEEIYEQLKTIQAYAHERGQTKVAESYGRSLTIVEQIRQEKKDIPLARLQSDRVYGEILEQTRDVFRH